MHLSRTLSSVCICHANHIMPEMSIPAVCCSVLQCVAVCCSHFRGLLISCMHLSRESDHACNEHSSEMTATHCHTLPHSATRCSTLQHTATHCNTPQHTPTHPDESHSHSTATVTQPHLFGLILWRERTRFRKHFAKDSLVLVILFLLLLPNDGDLILY